jgi:hypothetical protein
MERGRIANVAWKRVDGGVNERMGEKVAEDRVWRWGECIMWRGPKVTIHQRDVMYRVK